MNEEDLKRIREIANRLTRELADKGRVIEGGWKGFEFMCHLDDAPEVQRVEMRKAFFAGAQHLFASLINMLDPEQEATGKELTGKELRRLDLLAAELKKFADELGAQKWQ